MDSTTSAGRSKRLQRGLSNRHIQLITIGSAIGTGLFMGSGKTISVAGPSVSLIYAIIGFFMFFFMRAMGELLLSNLQYKSFVDCVEDMLGPWAGFFCGWTYWFCWIVTGTADVIAISGYLQFWFPDLQPWIPAVGVVLFLIAFNRISVKMFGELEFWFVLIKIIAILGIIGVGVFLVLTGFVSPAGHKAQVANLWMYGGFAPKGLMGFLAGFQIALFAFVGVELVGTTAAETASPETNMPRAINAIPLRIIFFYVFSLLAIMCITPWNLLDPEKSPFVTVFSLAGIGAAAGLINFVVMTSATSSINGGIYSTSRMMYGLAVTGLAPKAFARLSQRHVPVNGLLFSCICLLLSSLILIVMPSIMAAFTAMTTLSSILFIFVWSLILCAYLSYRKKYPERHAISRFKVPGGILMAILTQVFFIAVLVILSLEDDTRLMLMLSPIWFITLAIGYHVSKKHLRPLIEKIGE